MGKGFDQLLPKTEQLKKEYFEVFLPELMGADYVKPGSTGEQPTAKGENETLNVAESTTVTDSNGQQNPPSQPEVQAEAMVD